MSTRENMIYIGGIRDNTFKKRLFHGLALMFVVLLLAGCGHGDDNFHGSAPTFVVQFLSDPAADGDIAFTPPGTYTISSAIASGNVLAGIDPASGDEFRGFLDFPLRGLHGLPLDAIIVSATLEIFINSTAASPPNTAIPLILDLVSFQPPTITVSDFDRVVQPPLLSMPFDILPSDTGTFVVIDVSALMDEVQLDGLPDFQLRLLLDFFVNAGLVEIEDSIAATAPLLTVEYL